MAVVAALVWDRIVQFMKRLGTPAKIFIVVNMLAALTLLAFLLVVGTVITRRMQESVDSNLRHHMESLRTLLASEAYYLSAEANTLAGLEGVDEALRARDAESLSHFAATIQETHQLDAVYIVTRDGDVLVGSAERGPDPSTVAGLDLVSKGLAGQNLSRTLVVGDVMWLVGVAPHVEPDGQIDSVFLVAREIDRDYLGHLGGIVGVEVAMKAGQRVVSSFLPENHDDLLASGVFSDSLITGEVHLQDVQIGTAPYRLLMASLSFVDSPNFEVGLLQPTGLIEDAIRHTVGRVTALGLVLMILAFVLSQFHLRNVFKPVHSLVQTAERIAAGQLDQPVAIQGAADIQALAVSLDQMRMRLQRYLEEQRRWNEELEAQVRARTQELEAARAFQQAVIDGVAEPIMVIGTDYRVRLMNRAAREFSYAGTAASESPLCYRISHWRDTPCNGARLACPLEQVRKSGQPVTVVHEHYRANGERRFSEIIASPLWGADGTFQGIIESIRDITERKRAEGELVRLRKAVEAAGEVIFLTDRNGIITYVNPEFTRLYGHSAEEVVGKTTPRILKSGMMTPRDYEVFWETLLSKQVVRGEVINKCKDGNMVTVEGSASPILDENEDIIGFLAIQRDITERKRAEQTLQRYAERLQALTAQLVEVAEAERQRVARELHDETSQALANLVVTLGTVARLTDDETSQRLEQIKRLAVDTLEGVNRIVLDLRPRLLDDYGLLPAIRWYAEERLDQTGVETIVGDQGTEMRLPPHTETAIFRVIQEAVNNIARHADASQARIRLTWEPSQLTVEIEDNGRGFDVEATMSGTKRDGGLGLLGMQERVALLEGTLTIESVPGGGTRLRIQVPLPEKVEADVQDQRVVGG